MLDRNSLNSWNSSKACLERGIWKRCKGSWVLRTSWTKARLSRANAWIPWNFLLIRWSDQQAFQKRTVSPLAIEQEANCLNLWERLKTSLHQKGCTVPEAWGEEGNYKPPGSIVVVPNQSHSRDISLVVKLVICFISMALFCSQVKDTQPHFVLWATHIRPGSTCLPYSEWPSLVIEC